jgi:hypothetical protein
VLANTGELLGTASWQRNSLVQDIKNGYLYSSEENEMGLREIVKYAISMN